MRIGVVLPHYRPDGRMLDAAGIREVARRIEASEIDSIWANDHTPVPGAEHPPEPLLFLAQAAEATEHVELGTCIFAVALRTPYDVAQRFYTIDALAPGRFTLGVGTGSQRREFETNGIEYDARFKRLRETMQATRDLVAGKPIEGFDDRANLTEEERQRFHVKPAGESTRPASDPTRPAKRIGLPRLVLGAWASEPQLRRAVTQYDGWMASGGPGSAVDGWKKVLPAGIELYRSLGGTRAMVSTIMLDLSAEHSVMEDEDEFSLICDPSEAAARLRILEDLGYDDVILWPRDFWRPARPGATDHYSTENLELLRSLLAKDTRDYRTAWS